MCGTCGDLAHDDLNDDLSGMFGSVEQFRSDFGLSGETKPGYSAEADPFIANVVLHYEPCKKCNGSGVFRSYTGRIVGNCFTCKGAKQIAFKTSPQDRAKARDAKANRAQAAITEWLTAHEAEFNWMVAAGARGFMFAVNMIEALNKYHHLTERQLAAVQRCMEQDAQRKVDAQQRTATAKVVDVSVIENAFANAMERGVKSPKLRLDTFRFSRAADHSANAGAIYVKDIESDEYLGKIVEGKFLRVRACTTDQEARIIAAACDPGAAAKAYGQRTGTCSICGRKLTKGESVDRMMGPICADNYGF